MKKIIICSANISQLDSLYDSNFLNNIKNTYEKSTTAEKGLATVGCGQLTKPGQERPKQ